MRSRKAERDAELAREYRYMARRETLMLSLSESEHRQVFAAPIHLRDELIERLAGRPGALTDIDTERSQ